MKAAVLMNPFAGGASRIRETANAIEAFCAGGEILSAAPYGGALFAFARQVRVDETLPYVLRLYAAVDALAAERPDCFIVAGGDGMAAYVASRLLKTGCSRPRLLGVKMGTANVGPIVSIDAATLKSMRYDELPFRPLGAIEAFDGEESVAFAFNDAVLGDTLISTVGGKACTISARLLAERGESAPKDPTESLGTFTLEKNGARLKSALPRVSQIVVSCVERENLFGRAVTGMLCFTAGRAERAALILSERPLITLNPDARGYTSLAMSEQLLFSETDRIRVGGLNEDVMLIADGNPYLRRAESVSFRYRANVIRAAAPS